MGGSLKSIQKLRSISATQKPTHTHYILLILHTQMYVTDSLNRARWGVGILPRQKRAPAPTKRARVEKNRNSALTYDRNTDKNDRIQDDGGYKQNTTGR